MGHAGVGGHNTSSPVLTILRRPSYCQVILAKPKREPADDRSRITSQTPLCLPTTVTTMHSGNWRPKFTHSINLYGKSTNDFIPMKYYRSYHFTQSFKTIFQYTIINNKPTKFNSKKQYTPNESGLHNYIVR